MWSSTLTTPGFNCWRRFRGKSSASTESIVVEFRPKVVALLKDECYRIYGVAEGTQEVTRTLTGAKNSVPYVSGYGFDAAPQGEFGIGCAAPVPTASPIDEP